MPIQMKRTDLFPDDINPLPKSGSEQQARLLDDELEVANADYVKALRTLSDDIDNIYTELTEGCLDVLEEVGLQSNLNVMDLCSGIGVVARELLATNLGIDRLTLVDLSQTILDRAVREIEAAWPRLDVKIDTRQLDLLVDDLESVCSGSYDLVVTCNAFMHFPRCRQKELVRSIRRILNNRSGVFIFQSHFKPLHKNWKRRIISEVTSHLRDLKTPSDRIANVAHHIESFHNHANLYDAYNWLEEAGFGYFDCIYRRSYVGIIAAIT